MKFSEIEVVCRVSGPQVETKVEPDPDLFTYRGLNKDPDPVFNGSEPSGNWRIGDLSTSLVPIRIQWMNRKAGPTSFCG